jgi:glyoxylase-like metal-dependent hydrolase (beta-lactamase superfamily II)
MHLIGKRRLLKQAGAILSGAAGLKPVRALADVAAAIDAFVKGPPVKDQPIKAISRHIFMIQSPDGFPTPANQGLMSNVTFVIGQQGVIVVDSGASLQIGEMAIRMLKTVTDRPVVGIVNTHYHGDHWLGNHAFVNAYGSDLPRYAHRETRENIEGRNGTFWHDAMIKWTNEATLGTRIIPPNHDVDHGAVLSLGDVHLKLHHYGRAHTPSDLVVEVIEDEVVCAGDVLMDHRIANMDDGSFPGTFETLDALQNNIPRIKVWLPAHGNAGLDVIAWHRSLFEGIYESCVSAVKQSVPLGQALEFVIKDPRVSSKAADTKGWDNNIGKYVSLAYLEAEQSLF